MLEKTEVIEVILKTLRQEFTNYVATSKRTRSAGNDAQTKAEGKYDTRSIEENYLADGQAKHALVAREALAAIDALPIREFDGQTPIDLGALIELALPTENLWFFLSPAAGGLEVVVEGQTITLLNPESPLGLQLHGRRQGDVIARPAATISRVL